ncbi:MAG TPA: SDR family oxidoreductase [Acidobacteriaceae bacterium]|nr:SDR family oxidoreductase [Acidobacteriaceae bacterium]
MAKERPLPSRVLALGATSAIAEATLRLFSERGASFFLVGRNAAKLSAVRDDLVTRGAQGAATCVMDLDNTDAHPAMVQQAIATLGGIDLALLAHGVLGDQAEAQRDFRAAHHILHTNFISAVSLLNALANYFEGERKGVLAVISSVAGDRGRKSNYIYGASKGGLDIVLQGIRHRLHGTNVQVLTIKPGFVATPMTAHLPRGPLFAQPAKVARDIVTAIQRRKSVLYTPRFWGLIMFAVRNAPARLFHKTNL